MGKTEKLIYNSNQHDLSFLLGPRRDIKACYLFTFTLDIGFLLYQLSRFRYERMDMIVFYDTLLIEPYGMKEVKKLCRDMCITLVPIQAAAGQGLKHHSKFGFNIYNDGDMDMHITSANITESDISTVLQFKYKTPTLKKQRAGGENCEFSLLLKEYLSHYVYYTEEAKNVMDQVLQYDFSNIKARLVMSTPNQSRIVKGQQTLDLENLQENDTEEMDSIDDMRNLKNSSNNAALFGLGRIKYLLDEYSNNQTDKYLMSIICSSISYIGKDFLDYLKESCRASNVSVIFPSKETVDDNKGKKFLSHSSDVCSYNKNHAKDIKFHHYENDKNILSHSKIYLWSDLKNAAAVKFGLFTSMNLSKGALGFLEKSTVVKNSMVQRQKHFELGVFKVWNSEEDTLPCKFPAKPYRKSDTPYKYDLRSEAREEMGEEDTAEEVLEMGHINDIEINLTEKLRAINEAMYPLVFNFLEGVDFQADDLRPGAGDVSYARLSRAEAIEAVYRILFGYRSGGHTVRPARKNDLGCFLPHKGQKVVDNEIYSVIRINGKNIHVHTLFYGCFNDAKLVYKTLGEHVNKYYAISHLCHRPNCVNPRHLVLDRKNLNEQRKTCNKKGQCQGHGNFPKCIFMEQDSSKRILKRKATTQINYPSEDVLLRITGFYYCFNTIFKPTSPWEVRATEHSMPYFMLSKKFRAQRSIEDLERQMERLAVKKIQCEKVVVDVDGYFLENNLKQEDYEEVTE